MKKILTFMMLFLPALANAQCPKPLSLTQLQTIFKSQDKEDILIELGFEKNNVSDIGVAFVRCRKDVSKKGDYKCSNFNEMIILLESGGVLYSIYDSRHYLNIKTFAKGNYKSVGKSAIKGDLYTKNLITYGFNVDIVQTDCGNTNKFSIWLSAN